MQTTQRYHLLRIYLKKQTGANEAPDTGSVSKTYKEFEGFHTKKTNGPAQQWAEDRNRHFCTRAARWPADT